MTTVPKPAGKPASPLFSTGPTRKRPGWTPDALDTASLGRSHRATHPKSRINRCTALIHSTLGLPDDYLVGIVPGSDTGAVEMAMWSLLGARGVSVLGWEAFGKLWVKDAVEELKPDTLVCHEADYGDLPDLSKVDFDHDVVFTWNGTASGVRVPDGDWIPDDRGGLTICDATSAVFAMEMPWHKLDVVTFSFQKALGGEGGHGVIILSPRAVERADSFQARPPRPEGPEAPQEGKARPGAVRGRDHQHAVASGDRGRHRHACLGRGAWRGKGLIARVDESFGHFRRWLDTTPHFRSLAAVPETMSQTALCLVVKDPWFADQDAAAQAALVKAMLALLAEEDVAVDINAYRDAPTGLRIWAGPTVDPQDIERLLPWVDWAYETVRAQHRRAAA